MKKCTLSFLMAAFLLLGNVCFAAEAQVTDSAEAQIEMADSASTASTDSASVDSAAATANALPDDEPIQEELAEVEPAAAPSFHQIIKEKIIEGGVMFMSIVLICLIIGLTVAVERVITLNMASTNVKKFMAKVKEALQVGGLSSAKEVCMKTPGPVASIIAQGLIRVPEGIDSVSDSIASHGSSEMMRLEKGLSWIQLFISVAPMFGFMGTVIGMIDAFDTIQMAEDIKIDQVAGRIKVALLTTVAGLIVAVILQFFYNYLTAKLDSLAEQMEDANNDFIDILVVTGAADKEIEEAKVRRAQLAQNL